MKAAVPLAAVLLLAAPTLSLAQTAPDPGAGGSAGSGDAARASQTVTLYGHVFGNGLDPTRGINGPMPANTVPPIGDNLFAVWQSDGCGIPTGDPSGAVAPGGPDCDSDPINKLVLFLTAGPVQVHSADDFNYSLLHNEHGRAKDLYLDTTKDIHAWFWGAADYFSWNLLCPTLEQGLPPDVACPWPSWGWDPGILPGFTVEATLYMASLGDYGQGASEPPPIANALAGAKVIAKGKAGPANLQTGLPGSPNAQEFDINLGKPSVDVIPKDQDIFLIYSWYEDINGQHVGLDYFKPWAGEQFPVHFTLPVKNPFDVELVIPQFIHNKVLIHGVLSSPWGSYDVDTKSVQLDIRDPTNSPVQLQHVIRSGDYSVAHGAHFKPVNITWVWDYNADKARPGTYKATVSGCDLENICSSTESTFTINADGTPGSFTIGRSGQQTASEGQLQAITGNAQPGSGNLSLASAPVPIASGGSERKAPGPDAGLLLAGAALLALAIRRRRP
jgi:hypothetical protein